MHALAVIPFVASLFAHDAARGVVIEDDAAVPRIAPVSPGVELPQVAFTGLELAPDVTPAIAVSPTALTVRGREVVALVDGELETADVRRGMRIPRLQAAASTLPSGRIALQVDRRVPFRTVVPVLASLHAAGHPDAALLARAGAEVLSAPVGLAPELASDVMLAADVAPALEVEVTHDAVRIVRGRAREPVVALTVARGLELRDLTTALAVMRARDGGEPAITVRVDGDVPVQEVVDVIGAVRATPEGAPLYPDVVLALGLE